MEIADKIYQRVKAMSSERASKVLDFVEFPEFKESRNASLTEGIDETDYILNNISLMQQIAQSQQTFQQGTGYVVTTEQNCLF